MRNVTISAALRLAILMTCGMSGSAWAQNDAAPLIPNLNDFSLPATRPSVLPTPVPTPVPTPSPTAAPSPTPTATRAPAPRATTAPRSTEPGAAQPRAAEPRAAETRATPTPTPAPASNANGAPVAVPTPSAVATPLPAAPAVPQADPTPAATPAVAADAEPEGTDRRWIWLILGIVLLAGAAFAVLRLRARSRDQGDDESHTIDLAPDEAAPPPPPPAPLPPVSPVAPVPAPPAPPPTPAQPTPAQPTPVEPASAQPASAQPASVQPAPPPPPPAPAAPASVAPKMLRPLPVAPQPDAARAEIEVTMRAVRAGTNLTGGAVNYEIGLRNTGDADATDIRVDIRLMNASVDQDAMLKALFSQFIEKPLVARFDLTAGQALTVGGMAMMPNESIVPLNIGGREFFVPVFAVNILYRATPTLDRQNAGAWVVGIEREPGARMVPFRLDTGPRMYDTVGQRPQGFAIIR